MPVVSNDMAEQLAGGGVSASATTHNQIFHLSDDVDSDSQAPADTGGGAARPQRPLSLWRRPLLAYILYASMVAPALVEVLALSLAESTEAALAKIDFELITIISNGVFYFVAAAQLVLALFKGPVHWVPYLIPVATSLFLAGANNKAWFPVIIDILIAITYGVTRLLETHPNALPYPIATYFGARPLRAPRQDPEAQELDDISPTGDGNHRSGVRNGQTVGPGGAAAILP